MLQILWALAPNVTIEFLIELPMPHTAAWTQLCYGGTAVVQIVFNIYKYTYSLSYLRRNSLFFIIIIILIILISIKDPIWSLIFISEKATKSRPNSYLFYKHKRLPMIRNEAKHFLKNHNKDDSKEKKIISALKENFLEQIIS